MGVRLLLSQQGQQLGVDLKNGAYVIGRDERADIVVPDGTVSGRHAEIQVLDDSCMIRDLGSSNGTFVNGEKIHAAKEIRPSDKIQVGAVPIGIEIRKEKAADAPKPVAPTARIEAQREAVREAKAKIPWNLQVIIAGTLAILSLTLIMMFVQIYSETAGADLRIAYRMKILAAQYIHVLGDQNIKKIPPPSFDTSLTNPVMVANAKGDILYPAPIPKNDGTLPPSPIVDKKTGKPFDALRLGMQKMDMKDSKGKTVEVRVFPIRSGGDLLGYVIARPALDAESSFTMSMVMTILATIVALLVLIFAVSPVVRSVRGQIDLVKSKVSPLTNGFINSLPRSRSVPELDGLAGEIESAIQKGQAASQGSGGGTAAGGSEYVAMLGDLVETATLPYCFVDQDFMILTQNHATSGIGELAKAKTGTSVFEGGMTNVQSRQLIEAIAEARKSGQGRARVTLTWSGSAHVFDVSVKAFVRGSSQSQMFGLLFNPSAA